ncbi:MAG TPA: TetR/AcrR family transcriptional regulator [Xanthobacteraceae bacterium]|nr:TetR/AcrR family transcriptional regulator [Xanthobacteraceae bacterium]
MSAGLRALARSGFTALKADTLAKRLGVSRGSFYWHFADVGAFHAAVLQRWREVALENIVAELQGPPGDRLQELIRRALSARLNLESAVRAWAIADEKVRAVVAKVDAERVRYLKKLLVEDGLDPDIAESRACVLNWTYLGRSLAPQSLHAEGLQTIVEDLSRLMRLRGRRRF